MLQNYIFLDTRIISDVVHVRHVGIVGITDLQSTGNCVASNSMTVISKFINTDPLVGGS
jgi:hypothetical protein